MSGTARPHRATPQIALHSRQWWPLSQQADLQTPLNGWQPQGQSTSDRQDQLPPLTSRQEPLPYPDFSVTSIRPRLTGLKAAAKPKPVTAAGAAECSAASSDIQDLSLSNALLERKQDSPPQRPSTPETSGRSSSRGRARPVSASEQHHSLQHSQTLGLEQQQLAAPGRHPTNPVTPPSTCLDSDQAAGVVYAGIFLDQRSRHELRQR